MLLQFIFPAIGMQTRCARRRPHDQERCRDGLSTSGDLESFAFYVSSESMFARLPPTQKTIGISFTVDTWTMAWSSAMRIEPLVPQLFETFWLMLDDFKVEVESKGKQHINLSYAMLYRGRRAFSTSVLDHQVFSKPHLYGYLLSQASAHHLSTCVSWPASMEMGIIERCPSRERLRRSIPHCSDPHSKGRASCNPRATASPGPHCFC